MKALRPLLRNLQGERRAHRPGGRRSADRERNRAWRPALILTLVITLLDWTVKAIIIAAIPLGTLTEVWEGRVALWHVKNPAMMLGLWGGAPLLTRQFLAGTSAILAALVLLQLVARSQRLPARARTTAWIFVGLTFGGMIGNIVERLIYGSVTDYLSFRWGELWLPPGNVADLALFLSIPLTLPVIASELKARARRGRVPLRASGHRLSGSAANSSDG